MAPIALLASALVFAEGSAALRLEVRQGSAAESPLLGSIELAFDDPLPLYGPEARAPDGRDRVLESRIALAQRLGALLLAANATLSTNLRDGAAVDFGYSAALSFDAAAFAFGLSAIGGLGDTHELLEPPCRRHHLGPLASWSFASGWQARAQAAIAPSDGATLARLQLAYAF